MPTILIARLQIIGGFDCMGAKYLPTKKDLKALKRFQKKDTLPKSLFKKPTGTQPAPKGKKP